MFLPEFKTTPLTEADLFSHMMSEESFIEVFNTNFSKSQGKGVDRLNGPQFTSQARELLDVASRKCLQGRYRFSPYLEHLKLKGRGKEPRIVGIPCIRDRVVLHQLNQFLAHRFPECVPRNIANSYIRTISTDFRSQPPDGKTFVCSSDIKTFYNSIKREHLEKVLSRRIKTPAAIALIRHAINTPIVPKNTPRSTYTIYKDNLGIPQGLAISNILAAVYLHAVDTEMSKLPVKYYRYVDDVLMYGDEANLSKALQSLSSRLKRRGLSLHDKKSGKSHFAPVQYPFSYLGYRFEWPAITVRDATIERLLQSIAGKFSDYLHNRNRRLETLRYLDEERLRDIFILELNERITGAISESKRYGWIAYFSQITDLTLLHKLDSIVAEMFSRMPDFKRMPPTSLRKFSRAYFEIKFNPTGGYVKNYDVIETRTEKLKFLVERGRVDPKKTLTDAQITEKYERYLKRVLSAMHADESSMY